MSSEPRDVDHLTGHRLSDRSRRESGRIAGLLVGERGWYTQLHTEGLAHTTCTGAVAQTLPSSLTGPLAHKVPKHTHTHTISLQGSLSSPLSTFLPADALFFPSGSY